MSLVDPLKALGCQMHYGAENYFPTYHALSQFVLELIQVWDGLPPFVASTRQFSVSSGQPSHTTTCCNECKTKQSRTICLIS